jgi:hypothetical protein
MCAHLVLSVHIYSCGFMAELSAGGQVMAHVSAYVQHTHMHTHAHTHTFGRKQVTAFSAHVLKTALGYVQTNTISPNITLQS